MDFNKGELLMYLRKSRADNPDESVEEVLAKHEKILQDFLLREVGWQVPEQDIYREVVSGESIADRVEIQKVLSRIEHQDVQGVVVVEPQRLSRGDLVDCGTLINILQYSHTLIITPMATYNMDNKMERRFFQDELLRGRDYLEYTKEILLRGKLASVNRGCYLQSVPPYGYDRLRIGKDFTLTPNSNADYVRLIFSLFAEQGLSSWEICNRLMEMGVPSPTGRKEWVQATVDKILRNKHYIGKVTYQRDKTVTEILDGEKHTARRRQADGDYICVDGKHPAIISEELFSAAQSRLAMRTPVRHDKILRNALAGILFCSKCGKPMTYKDKGIDRAYLVCKTPGCSKSVKYAAIMEAVTQKLEQESLPELQARLDRGDGEAAEMQKKIVKNLEKELNDLKSQEERQYELLETRVYTNEVFEKRNKILRDRMQAVQSRLTVARRTMPESVNYEERIISLSEAVRAVKSDSIPENKKNIMLRSVVERIDCNSAETKKRGEYDVDLDITLRI